MDDEPLAFQERMVMLTRAFGWHRPGETPCGRSVPIAEAHALLELSRSPHLTQQELAERLNLQKSTVSRLVSHLCRRGWIERRRCEEDRRAYELFLTDVGVSMAEDLAEARGAKMAGVLLKVPDAERAAVLAALDTLIQAIHESDL
ncbi:MAG: winged helix-turn-helix transcriptional regulator [Gemmatimonadetes bacterium]|nr:winged helix-turn-helix transcriptional regulator [Gemmatimonadota bacterium]